MKAFRSSPTNAVNAEMNRLRNEGIHIYNFASGDPVVPNHAAILEEAKKAVAEKMSPYVPVGGIFQVRDAAAEWMHRRYGVNYNRDHTIITCGGKFALFAALEALVEPGDEVLFTAPYWPSYLDMISFVGAVAKPISLSEKTGWKLSKEEFKRHIGKKTKLFLLNNGCNPTGVLYSKEEIGAFLNIAKEAGLYVISDEVYSELVYDGAKYVSCSSFPEHYPRLVIIESCSKNFAMAGWRVGFAFAEPKLIQTMIAIQSQTTTGTSHVSQRAALGALLHSSEVASEVRRAMQVRRDLFSQTYNKLFASSFKPVPSALYFFTKIKLECKTALHDAHVALVPGEAFGLEGYVRFAFSEREQEIVEGLQRLHLAERGGD